MIKPQIIIENYEGINNANLEKTKNVLIQGSSYKDLSTICIIPSRGQMATKVVQCWFGMMMPMNQKFIRITVVGMEVGAAYNSAVETILANPELSKWKYMLTLEDDNTPPPDGLLKLYENMDKFDAIGGLYFIKGIRAPAMIYGDPNVFPKNFIPQLPILDKDGNGTVQQCNGLGMGFTLFKIDMFKDPRLSRPFFETVQRIDNQGVKCYTQDLHFFERVGNLGYKFACDGRVKVGHYDYENDIFW